MPIRLQGHPPLERQAQAAHPGVVLPMSYFGAHWFPFDPDWQRLLDVFTAFGVTDVQVWFEQRWLSLWGAAADWWEVTLKEFGC